MAIMFNGYKVEFLEDSKEWFVLNPVDTREQYNLPPTNSLQDVKSFISSIGEPEA